jgi:hypothetical protein
MPGRCLWKDTDKPVNGQYRSHKKQLHWFPLLNPLPWSFSKVKPTNSSAGREQKWPWMGRAREEWSQDSRKMKSLWRGFRRLHFISLSTYECMLLALQLKKIDMQKALPGWKRQLEDPFRSSVGVWIKGQNFTAYQNSGDNERSVSQRICDIVGPVSVAIRHVQPTVGVPNPNLHRTQDVRGRLLPATVLRLNRGPAISGMGPTLAPWDTSASQWRLLGRGELYHRMKHV